MKKIHKKFDLDKFVGSCKGMDVEKMIKQIRKDRKKRDTS